MRFLIQTSSILSYAVTYPGDSGLGIYLDAGDGKYILCSHYTSVGGGPSYTKGYEILKAWIEANGDTVKTWNPDE